MTGSPLTENLKKEMKILERTIFILGIIEREEPIGIVRLSEVSGLPEHKVRYSLRMLQREELIEPTPVGAKTTDKHDKFKHHLNDLLNRLSEMSVKLQQQMKN